MVPQVAANTARSLKFEKRNLDTPDEIKSPPLGKVETLRLQGRTFTRFTMQPGWQWSKSVKPLVGGDYCETPHVFYVVSGRQVVTMRDGQQLEFGPGDAAIIPPGHDVRVVGKEPNVLVAID